MAFEYRDTIKDPLDAAELRQLFAKLGVPVSALLRTRDKSYKELGLTGDESDETLFGHLAAHPGLLDRPLGVSGNRAVYGRPIENLLTLK